MKRVDEKMLIKSNKIKSALKKQGVVLAYLFGSQAKGFTHKDSDVDIAVLFDKRVSPQRYFDKSLKLPNVFEELFPGKERVVTVLNEAPPLLRREVLSGSKLLYSRSEPDRINFHIHTIHDYEDTKYLRNMQYQYLRDRILGGEL